MALDTRNKRASAVHVAMPWRGLLPEPDGGALDQGDRQQVAFMYSGVGAGPVISSDPIEWFQVPAQDRWFKVES